MLVIIFLPLHPFISAPISHRGSHPTLCFTLPLRVPDGQPHVLFNLHFPQLYHAFMWQKISRLSLFSPPPSSSLSLHSNRITVVMLAACSWFHSNQLLPFITAYYPDVGSCTVPIASNTCPQLARMHTHKNTDRHRHKCTQTCSHTHANALKPERCTTKTNAHINTVFLHILYQLLPPLFMSHLIRHQRAHTPLHTPIGH